MKSRFSFRLALLGLLAVGSIASAAAAAPSPAALAKPPGSNSCHAVWSTCMFNGTAVRVCSARRADCERGLLLLGAADAVEQPTSLIADLAEQNLVHAERFGAMTTVAWTGGAGYCWKMAYACTRGNQNACDMYDRHCEPAE